jgi:hypothetical protein
MVRPLYEITGQYSWPISAQAIVDRKDFVLRGKFSVPTSEEIPHIVGHLASYFSISLSIRFYRQDSPKSAATLIAMFSPAHRSEVRVLVILNYFLYPFRCH